MTYNYNYITIISNNFQYIYFVGHKTILFIIITNYFFIHEMQMLRQDKTCGVRTQ